MAACKREANLTVVESWRRLPCVVGVTWRAIRAKLAAVLIFVTGSTSGREPKECPVRIFDLNGL